MKVLPQEFTRDPDRLARFEREARMLATLNHPNICGIYGLEEADGIRFLVLELVDGQTLAVRLGEAGGPLPVPEALNIGQQVACALEVAHERGVNPPGSEAVERQDYVRAMSQDPSEGEATLL